MNTALIYKIYRLEAVNLEIKGVERVASDYILFGHQNKQVQKKIGLY